MQRQETEKRKRKQETERNMRTERNLAASVFLLKRKGRRGKARAMESRGDGEFTKAAQEGPHYDIKQDLISESDLMRWLSWPINQAGFWPRCNMAHLSPYTKASLDAELLTALTPLQKQHQAKKNGILRLISQACGYFRCSLIPPPPCPLFWCIW